jgi:hypothetical protein
MPKAFSTKNINKLIVYLEQNGSKATNTKPNYQADKGYSAKPRPN